MRRASVAWLLLVLLAHALLYWRVPQSGFVTDDFLWLEDAGRQRSWWQHAVSREPFGYLRPMFHLLMLGSRRCFGLDATALHLLAIACSVLSAGLLAAIVRRATGSVAAAGVAALWLTVHPTQAIAVGWVSSLPSLLAMAFGLAGVWCWQRWLQRGAAGSLAASVLLHALALCAKEEAVVVVAAIVAWSLLRGGRRSRWALLHVAVAVGYLVAWQATGVAKAPYLPVGADWLWASADPLLRVKALWLPRHVVTSPFAELLLAAFAWLWWRRDPRARRTWLVAALLAVVALLPSSVGLWGFRWDKMDRLLLPALPAAAFVAGCWCATWRRGGVWPRRMALGFAVLMLVLFTVRSHKTVQRRLRDAARVQPLVAALAQHRELLQRDGGDGVALLGYDVDWSEERAWIYPSGPARAVLPGVRLLPEERAAEAGVVLVWDPARSRFEPR